MTDFSEKLNEARQLKRHFKLSETIEKLKECLEIDPESLIAAAQAGLCCMLIGDPTQARYFLAKAFELSKQQDIPTGLYYAAALTADDKEDKATEIRMICASVAPDLCPAETYMLSAEMMAEKKNFDAAVRLIDVLSSNYSDTDFFKHAVNHYRLIHVLALAEIFEIAEPLADSLLEQTPDSWEGLAAKASVLMAKKNYDEAYSYTVRALQHGGAVNPILAAQQHWLAMNK